MRQGFTIRITFVFLLSFLLSACGVPDAYKWPRTPTNVTVYDAFSINRDGTEVAFHFYHRRQDGGRTSYSIAIYDIEEDRLSEIAAPDGLSDWHSPSFGPDGHQLAFISNCFRELCDTSHYGSRVGIYDLTSGQSKLLTDSGRNAKFWLDGYGPSGVLPIKTQISRGQPLISGDGREIFYLASNMRPDYYTRLRDFVIRRVNINGSGDDFLLTDDDGVLLFTQEGSLAPFGTNAIAIRGGPGYGGHRREYLWSIEPVAYFYSIDHGLSEKYLTRDDLRRLEIPSDPRGYSLVGSFGRREIFFLAGDFVLMSDGSRLEIAHSEESLGFQHLADLALSADGRHLVIVGRTPGREGALGFWIIDRESGARRWFDAAVFSEIQARQTRS